MKMISFNKYFIGLIFIITTVLYLPSLHSPFVYDDLNQIRDNENIQSNSISKIIKNGLRETRVIQNLTFALNWKMSPKMTWSFHITNLLLHLLNLYLLIVFLRMFLKPTDFILGCILLLCAIHPLQIQSVVYIMGRISLLTSISTLLIIILYLKEKNNFFLYLVIGLSIMIKESMLIFPLYLYSSEYILKQNKPNYKRASKVAIIGLSIQIFILILFHFLNLNSSQQHVTGYNLYPVLEYQIIQFKNWLFYLWLIFNPADQSIIHFYKFSTYYIPLSFISICLFSWFIWKIRYLKINFPNHCYLLLLIIINLLPTSSPIQMINPFAEYRLYFSNFFILSLLVLFLSLSRYFKYIMSLFVIYYLFFNFNIQTLYRNPILALDDSLQNYPESAYPYAYLATQILELKGEPRQAELLLKKSIELMKNEPIKVITPHFMLSKLYILRKNYFFAYEILSHIDLSLIRNRADLKAYYFMFHYCSQKIGHKQLEVKNLLELEKLNDIPDNSIDIINLLKINQ